MVVCKFFQQGNCRYGQNCAYEHVYGSKYSYHANTTTQSKPQQTGVTDEQLVNQVQSDIQAVLNGGQWIFSSYAPYKEKPAFPGIIDLSPEEARLFIYEAKANNNLDQAIAYINNLTLENRSKYEQLIKPNSNIIKILRSLYKGETPPSPFITVQNNVSSNPSSLFRSAVQNTVNQSSVFSQSTPSIFSQNVLPQNNQSVFNQNTNVFATQETAAKSIFAQASQSMFGPQPTQTQNAFTSQSPSNLFASANQSMFGPKEPQNTIIFPNADMTQVPQNMFQKLDAQVVQGSQNVFQPPIPDDRGIYSKIEELTEDDLEEYRKEEFVLGFVPVNPPPQSLCF